MSLMGIPSIHDVLTVNDLAASLMIRASIDTVTGISLLSKARGGRLNFPNLLPPVLLVNELLVDGFQGVPFEDVDINRKLGVVHAWGCL